MEARLLAQRDDVRRALQSDEHIMRTRPAAAPLPAQVSKETGITEDVNPKPITMKLFYTNAKIGKSSFRAPCHPLTRLRTPHSSTPPLPSCTR